MNTRVTALCASVLLTLTLGACGQAPATPTTDDQTASSTEDTTATTAKDFEGDQYAEVGKGTAYVSLGDKSSLDGQVVAFSLDEQEKPVALDIHLEKLSDQGPVYVYVDGVLSLKMEGSAAEGQVLLKGNDLRGGIHSVEMVQYADGDTDGSVTFYRVARYSVEP